MSLSEDSFRSGIARSSCAMIRSRPPRHPLGRASAEGTGRRRALDTGAFRLPHLPEGTGPGASRRERSDRSEASGPGSGRSAAPSPCPGRRGTRCRAWRSERTLAGTHAKNLGGRASVVLCAQEPVERQVPRSQGKHRGRRSAGLAGSVKRLPMIPTELREARRSQRPPPPTLGRSRNAVRSDPAASNLRETGALRCIVRVGGAFQEHVQGRRRCWTRYLFGTSRGCPRAPCDR